MKLNCKTAPPEGANPPFLKIKGGLNWMQQIKNSPPIKADILDVGCGYQQRGSVNLEKFRPSIKPNTSFVMSSLPDLEWLTSHLPFKDETFDEVKCIHVLEHLDEPFKALKEIVRVSKHLITVTVPHGIHPYSRLSKDHKSFFKPNWFVDAFEILKCYSYVHSRLDNERSIKYLPVEIFAQGVKMI